MDHRDKDAADFLAQLPNSQRAYVTLQSAVDENWQAGFQGR